MKKIICICISLVFGCGKPNSVVKREADVSSVSILDNQKQDSIIENSNELSSVRPRVLVQDQDQQEIASWIFLSGIIMLVSLISLILTLGGVGQPLI
jgi:hypothetical protein